MSYVRSGKAIYYKNGGMNELIADAENEEKAHSIVTALNQRSPVFIADALTTCSPMFHGDMVSDLEFRAGINECIDCLSRLDRIKKSLFYGRDNNLISDGENDASDIPDKIGNDRAVAVDIIHAILGLATEAGELLEALRSYYNGDPVDWVNLMEETGDGFWYAALLAHRGDFTFEEVQNVIISKLRARFPEKFKAADANERNLIAERAILEDGLNPLVEEPTGVISDDMAASLDNAPPPLNLKSADILDANKAELESNSAFAAVDNVGSDMVDAPDTGGTGQSELSKSPGARSKALPDEHIARQSIRREDLNK